MASKKGDGKRKASAAGNKGEQKRDDTGEMQREARALVASAHQAPPAPVEEEELVPAETLFAATLMANEMVASSNPAEALLRHPGPAWTPPDSPLRLKDKLV